ncbi:hypothetical protein [Tardiphaga sp.]|uniref:hypothetical protein n=1 Tax=Tardiphaga sp. TaxID=1926292 RepID=UPI00261BCF38|nr:hypothetical protein [Tardiphaga sp.]
MSDYPPYRWQMDTSRLFPGVCLEAENGFAIGQNCFIKGGSTKHSAKKPRFFGVAPSATAQSRRPTRSKMSSHRLTTGVESSSRGASMPRLIRKFSNLPPPDLT